MPFAGANTASLEDMYHRNNQREHRMARQRSEKLRARYERERRQRTMRSTTVDTLFARYRLREEVLIFKIECASSDRVRIIRSSAHHQIEC